MSDTRDTTVAPAAREWVFKAQGQVFGPVPEARLAALVEAGELGPGTEVAGDDGRWRPLREVPRFLVHLRRGEARARVESEATAVRRLARRRGALRGVAIAAACALLVALVGSGAFWFAARRARTSALLADFGEGITISAATVGAGAQRAEGAEIAVPDAAAAGGGGASSAPRPKRVALARPPAPRGSAEGGSLVLAQYDPRRIQDAVARQRASLAPCLREEAARSPEFAGEIPIEFAVGNDGRVAQLWIDEPRFKSGALRECLLRKLADWAFDPFPGQRPVVSLAFSIGR
jgi:GYF domain 2